MLHTLFLSSGVWVKFKVKVTTLAYNMYGVVVQLPLVVVFSRVFFFCQVCEPLQPRQPGGVDAPALRAHGRPGWVLELRPLQVVQGATVAAVHSHDGPTLPVGVLRGLPLAQPHVPEISFHSGV